MGSDGIPQLLLRVNVGPGAAALTESVPLVLAAGQAQYRDAVCQPRWINWLLPEGATLSTLVLQSEKPVRVYAVEIYREKR